MRRVWLSRSGNIPATLKYIKHLVLTPSLLLATALGVTAEGMAEYKTIPGEDLRTVLIGKVDAQDYLITNQDDPDAPYPTHEYLASTHIKAVGDFDNDGWMDALVTMSEGGAASMPRYYVA